MLYYKKIVILKNGSRVLIRFLKNGDQPDVIKFLQTAAPEDFRYLTLFSADPRHLEAFLEHYDYSNNISLLALEIDQESIIGAAFSSQGQGAAGHIGKVYWIFVARPFQQMGLGTLLLDECVRSIRLSRGLSAGPVQVSTFPCGAPRS